MGREDSKIYWKGIEERERTPIFESALEGEFAEPLPDDFMTGDRGGISRRSFLRAAGFSVAGSLLVSCSREPVEKAIPLLMQGENMMPGKAYWYASTCGGCQAGCGILTKNREGRPIKIEGNPEHPLSQGGLCAVGQAMVLGMYDSQRLGEPLANGTAADWATVDGAIGQQLAETQDGVYVLSGTITSSTTLAMIEKFLGRFDNSAHVVYDPVSYAAILEAHEGTHGRRALPHYGFDRADVIVGVEADFLGTWISPVEFTKGYTGRRALEGENPELSHHIQFEGRMSLTGSNADRRVRVTPAECGPVLRGIAERLAEHAGESMPQLAGISGATAVDAALLDDVAQRLWQAKGKSLVVCGVNDTGIQCLVNGINQILDNYGATVDIEKPSLQWQGDDRAVVELIESMQAGRVKALIMADTNPAYSLPHAQEFIAALKKVPLTVSLAQYVDETAAVSGYVCPIHHALEAWNDAEVVAGTISMAQPVIMPLGQTRTLRECLSAWTDGPREDLAILQAHWRESIYPRREEDVPFQKFWDRAVHDGYTHVKPLEMSEARYRPAALWPQVASMAAPDGKLALVLYEKIGMRDGRHAYNPWLHEMPDPLTKVVWENYACLAPATASRLGLQEGDMVAVAGEGESIELPVQIQPGQHEGVVAVAVGYGRAGTDRFSRIGPQWIESRLTVEDGETIGANGFPLARVHGGTIVPFNAVSITSTGRHSDLALTQTHHTITVPEELGGHRRNMVRETTLAAYGEDPASGNHFEHDILQLWANDYEYTGHHWALAIDLNKCTGCSACMVGCQAENNVPVVGKDEVFRRREMHWIRIDRYYSGTDGDVDVMHQPVMCQHCDHAPCEAVCPVLATVHSDEGINQQIYNRCVGTRYCANNCPYKVRRFNWFDYRRGDQRENLVLNPDLTTRTRGVMEKCSLCAQRIQEAKAEAKRRNRPLGDGDIQVACQQSCPADAILFGDMNDSASRVAKSIETPRHYRMLEEMNYRPTVGYLTKVRNRDEDAGEKG